MPIYEYTCLDCGSHFEALRRMSDADSVIKCKECDSTRTRRQISACFSRVEGGSSRSSSSGCVGCSGGSCSTCGH